MNNGYYYVWVYAYDECLGVVKSETEDITVNEAWEKLYPGEDFDCLNIYDQMNVEIQVSCRIYW